LPAQGEVSLRLLTKKDPEALAVMRHSAAHVMARAVMRLFDGVQLAFGPTTESGFYYDFEMKRPLSEDDFGAIEAEMARIIKLDEPFERLEEPRDKAVAICRDLNQTLKVEHINEGLADHATLSFYRQGDLDRWRLLEGRCVAPTVAAAVCHRLVLAGRVGRAFENGRGG
jgi:threonyl-tRNA synthetase